MEPIFLEPDGGEIVSDDDERWVVIKAGLDQVTVTESRYAVGERGPEPHVHREHADCFWALEGELTFGLADETARMPAGSFVVVPPNVVHTFSNEGPGDARFLNVHAPSGGFADYLRAQRDGDEAAEDRFDTYDPPDDGGRPAADAVVRPRDEGERVKTGAAEALAKAEGDDGDSTFSLAEVSLPPNFPGPPPHRHETFVDSFYVLDGTLSVQLGEDVVDATPGAFAFVPPGAVHTFANTSENPVRHLNLMAPGGFEQYLKEMAAETAGGETPDPLRMAAIASKYDFHPAVQAY